MNKPTYNEVTTRVAHMMEDYKCPKKCLVMLDSNDDFELKHAMREHLNLLCQLENLRQALDTYPEHPLHEDPMND